MVDVIDIRDIISHFENNKTKQFKNIKDDISDYVGLKTSFLEESASYGQRLWHIKNNVYEIPVCKSCGKLSKWDRRKQRYFLYCCVECHTKGQIQGQINKHIELTKINDSMRFKMEKENGNFDPSVVKFTEELRLHLIDFAKRFNNSREKHYEYDIITYITYFLPKNVSFLQRVWHLKNNTYEIPKCEICGKKVSFSTNIKYNRFCCDECRLTFYRSDENKERIKKNWQEKYGIDNYSKTHEHKQMSNVKSISHFKQKLIDYRLDDTITYISKESGREHLFRCNECGCDFIITSSLFNYRYNSNSIICTNCNKQRIKTKSFGELEVKEFLELEFPNIFMSNSNKDVIKPYELDIYFPELRIGIEYNGDYWHANPEFYKKDDIIIYKTAAEIWEKDELKKQLCKDKDINLITIWENDWKNKEKETKKKLLDDIKEIIEKKDLIISSSGFMESKKIKSVHILDVKKSIENFLIENKISFVYHKDRQKFIIDEHHTVINLLSIKKVYKHNEIFNSFQYYKNSGKNAIYIYDDNYSEKRIQYEKYLEKVFNINQSTIYARKCEIKIIEEKSIVNDFCDAYHLQGKTNYTVAYGLYYNEELVEIMSFKVISKERDEWEISRLCSKSNIIVIGGANRLWKKFLKEINPSMCLTYSDVSLFSGNVYRNMELMEEKNISEPNYWYTNGEIRLSRRQCQKNDLLKYFPNYKHLSEVKIMTEKLGFHIVENCGNYKFIYKKCQIS